MEYDKREPREGQELRDKDAEAVQDHVSTPLSYTPSTPGQKAPVTPPMMEIEYFAEELKHSSEVIDEIEMGSNLKRDSDMLGGHEPHTPQAKAPRVDEPSSSPSRSENLFPPFFAGRVDMYPHDDDVWETTAEAELENESFFEDLDIEEDDGDFQEEQPPQVSEAELEALDGQAKVENLKALNVVWRRRCRIVAREFRCGQATNPETFSPTTATAVIRQFFLLHLLYTSLQVEDDEFRHF